MMNLLLEIVESFNNPDAIILSDSQKSSNRVLIILNYRQIEVNQTHMVLQILHNTMPYFTAIASKIRQIKFGSPYPH